MTGRPRDEPERDRECRVDWLDRGVTAAAVVWEARDLAVDDREEEVEVLVRDS